MPTGLNKRVAAYAYRGGSVFDRRDFYIGAALIKHPQGDLLVDSGFGRDIAWQSATMPRYFRAITGTSCASRPPTTLAVRRQIGRLCMAAGLPRLSSIR